MVGKNARMARNEPRPNRTSDSNARASDSSDPDPALMQEAIEREAQSSIAPSAAALTPGQTKGGIGGALIGGVLGLVIGALISLAPIIDLEFGTRLLVIGSVAALAGSVIGALLGGFFRPDREGETGSLPGEGRRSKGERRSGHAQ